MNAAAGPPPGAVERLYAFRPLRFVLVGVLNTAVDYGVFALLFALGAPLLAANSAGYILGACNSFAFNRGWTFRAVRRKGGAGRQLAAFFAATFASLACSNLLVWLLSLVLSGWTAKALSLPAVMLLNYLAYAWIFRRIGPPASPAPPCFVKPAAALPAAPAGGMERAAVLALFAAAAALRLWHLDWGLPRFYGLDEMFFFAAGFQSWRLVVPDFGWYGHPGTFFFWSQIPAFALARLWAVLQGTWEHSLTAEENVRAHAPLFTFALRLQLWAWSLLGLALAARLGRVVWGPWGGAATLLFFAAAPMAVEHARIIRTDTPFVALVLLAQLAALRLADEHPPARRRDWWLAGACVGLAVATRWFGVAAAAAVAAAWAAAPAGGGVRARVRAGAGADPTLPSSLPARFKAYLAGRAAAFHLPLQAALASLLVFALVAPFILKKFSLVLEDVLFESRETHLGETARDLPHLLQVQWQAALENHGGLGLLLAALGTLALFVPFAPARARLGAIVLAFPLAYAALMAVQDLSWERWLLPLLPSIALLQAGGLLLLARTLAGRGLGLGRGLGRTASGSARHPALGPIAGVLIAALVVLNPLSRSLGQTRALGVLTQEEARAWMLEHVPPGASVFAEWRTVHPPQGRWRFHAAPFVSAEAVAQVGPWLAPDHHPLGGAHFVLRPQSILAFEWILLGSAEERLRRDAELLAGSSRPSAAAAAAQARALLERYSMLRAASEEVAVFAPVPGAVAGPRIEIRRVTRPSGP